MVRTLIGAALIAWGGFRLISRNVGAVVDVASDEVSTWFLALDKAVNAKVDSALKLQDRQLALETLKWLVRNAPGHPGLLELVKQAVQAPYNSALAKEGWLKLNPTLREGLGHWRVWKAELEMDFPPPDSFVPKPPPPVADGDRALPIAAIVGGGVLVLFGGRR